MSMDVKNTSTSTGLDQSLKIQTTRHEEVDRAGTEQETIWQSSNWKKYLGYYKSHVAVKGVINKLGMWSVGKGYEANNRTTKILEGFVGWGKDTFEEIIDNQVRIRHVNGDSYAEIIKDESGKLVNLKPLNPGSMVHVVNPQGMLKGYRQVQADGKERPLDVDQVFHLVLNRTADEIHGTGDVESIITFLDKIKQVDEDMTVMFHRYVLPLLIWKLNTDDTTAISNFKTQEKAAWNKAQNLVVPEKAVEWDMIEAGKNGVNPMEWRNKWTEEVIKGGGVPALIMAIEAGTTEASSKMVYLAWQQVVEKEQRDVEAQIKSQLGLKVKFNFPATIQESVGEDERKDAEAQTKIKPGDATASVSEVKNVSTKRI